MPWVQYDKNGAIAGVCANRQNGAFSEQFLSDDDPAIIDYLHPPVVARSISDRQFFQQLAILGVITEDEALASNAAVIPAPLLGIIEALPEDQRFAAKMIVSGATTFERSHPMTLAIGAAHGWTAEQIDAFFNAAAAL